MYSYGYGLNLGLFRLKINKTAIKSITNENIFGLCGFTLQWVGSLVYSHRSDPLTHCPGEQAFPHSWEKGVVFWMSAPLHTPPSGVFLTVFKPYKVAQDFDLTNLCKTSVAAPQWRLCASTCASPSRRSLKKRKWVLAKCVAPVRDVNQKKKKLPQEWASRPDERWLVDVCSPMRLDAAAEQTLSPSLTFLFVFAALSLNNGEPIRGEGCHGEGAGSDNCVCVCVCVKAWSMVCLFLFVSVCPIK